ncbi:MAG: sensor histidine kinase [Spirochaetaceae bacterium]
MDTETSYRPILHAAAVSCLDTVHSDGAFAAARVADAKGEYRWISSTAGNASLFEEIQSIEDLKPDSFSRLLKKRAEGLAFSVPLMCKGEVSGILGVSYRETETLSWEDSSKLPSEFLTALKAQSSQLVSILQTVPSLMEAMNKEEKKDKKATDLTELPSPATLDQVYLNSLFRNSPEAIVLLDEQNKVLRINPEFTRLYGFKPEEVKGKHIDEIIAGKERREEANRYSRRAESGESFSAESIRYRKDGTPVDVSILGAPVEVEGKIIGIFGIYRDISHRREIERKLAENEKRYRSLIEEAPVGIFQTSSWGSFINVNRTAAHILGFDTPEELIDYYRDIKSQLYVHPARRDLFLQTLRENGEITNYEYLAVRKDGTQVWLTVNARISKWLDDGEFLIDGFVSDTSLLKEASKNLEKSLKDKEILLQEVHHRVKNNMQIISSILNLEADEVKDSAAEEALKTSQSRIRAMSLIHEKLYHSDEMAFVDLEDYTKSLCREVVHFTTLTDENRPFLNFSMEKLYAEIDFSIPFGLIVNELIINAYKHAFIGIDAPEIRIRLYQKNKHIILELSDNGVGLPRADMSSSGISIPSGLGIQLIYSLVEQLQGTIAVSSSNGTAYTLCFPMPAGETV